MNENENFSIIESKSYVKINDIYAKICILIPEFKEFVDPLMWSYAEKNSYVKIKKNINSFNSENDVYAKLVYNICKNQINNEDLIKKSEVDKIFKKIKNDFEIKLKNIFKKHEEKVYDITLNFSCFDVLDGEELLIDNILIDNKILNFSYIENDGKYFYTTKFKAKTEFSLRIEKNRYFPFKKNYNLNNDSTNIDLGRIGLLNEIKENAIVLTWGKTPIDLDSRLVCPNKEIVGIIQSEKNDSLNRNFYANVSVDDKTSEGPETITINHWVDFNSKNRIGKKFKFYVNWYKD